MLGVVTTIAGVDVRSARMKRLVREAADYGLDYHRKRYLPLHFKAVARARYGAAYAKRGKSARKSTRSRSPERRARPNAGLVNRDRGNKVPLYHTGLLKSKVLQGGVKVSGRYDKRKIKYSPPYYTFMNNPGQIHKLDALRAVTADEEKDVYEKTKQKFLKLMNAKQTRKRG